MCTECIKHCRLIEGHSNKKWVKDTRNFIEEKVQMSNKYEMILKLVTREIQTEMRCCFITCQISRPGVRRP